MTQLARPCAEFMIPCMRPVDPLMRLWVRPNVPFITPWVTPDSLFIENMSETKCIIWNTMSETRCFIHWQHEWDQVIKLWQATWMIFWDHEWTSQKKCMRPCVFPKGKHFKEIYFAVWCKSTCIILKSYTKFQMRVLHFDLHFPIVKQKHDKSCWPRLLKY